MKEDENSIPFTHAFPQAYPPAYPEIYPQMQKVWINNYIIYLPINSTYLFPRLFPNLDEAFKNKTKKTLSLFFW